MNRGKATKAIRKPNASLLVDKMKQTLSEYRRQITKDPIAFDDRQEMKNLCSNLNIPDTVEESYFTLTRGTKINYMNDIFAEAIKTLRTRDFVEFSHFVWPRSNLVGKEFYEKVPRKTRNSENDYHRNIKWILKTGTSGPKMQLNRVDRQILEFNNNDYLENEQSDRIRPLFLDALNEIVEVDFTNGTIPRINGRLKRQVFILNRKFRAPFHWAHQSHNFLVEKTTEEVFTFIKGKFEETLKGKQIHGISQIQNQLTYQKYAIRRDLMLANQNHLSEQETQENDKILFFAQPDIAQLNVLKLLEEADFFNTKRYNLPGNCCFTPSASYADQFSFVDEMAEPEKKMMIVALVSIGKFAEANPDEIARPNQRDSLNGMPIHYDSVFSKKIVGSETVECWDIYEPHSAYPAFIIEYS